jgi:hypothetical protein
MDQAQVLRKADIQSIFNDISHEKFLAKSVRYEFLLTLTNYCKVADRKTSLLGAKPPTVRQGS